jgi:hypothetical protein
MPQDGVEYTWDETTVSWVVKEEVTEEPTMEQFISSGSGSATE